MRTDFENINDGDKVVLYPNNDNPLHKAPVVVTYQSGYFYSEKSIKSNRGADYYLGDVALYNFGFKDHKKPTITMPKALTAENGAKAALMGEFNVNVTYACHECNIVEGEGVECDVCGGIGEYSEKWPVSWTTIKEIYAKAVEHFEKHPELVEK